MGLAARADTPLSEAGAAACVDVTTLESRWEEAEAALGLESYRQYAGLGHDEARMDALSAALQELAREGLESLRRDDLPPLLWQAMVSNRAARDFTRLQNETYRLRNQAVAVEAAGEKVDLNSVRLFNHRHLREHALRRRVFEGLMEKASALTPTLEARFRLSASLWAPHGMTPLDVYCVEERLSKERLRATVDRAATRAKPAFLEAMAEFSAEILGKPFEAYDDMYVFRHSIYNPVDPRFAKVDFHEEFRKVGARLGFPVGSVHVDGEPREGKFSSPVCFGVRIPGDVRVLYQRTTPIGDYESFYHEMGHAMHFISVGAGRRLHERRLIPNGVAEIFSTLFEELSMDPVYLTEDLGIPAEAVDEVLRRRRFMELFFLCFYGANGMHKVRFWEERLHEDFEAADEAYADLTERYMGVRYPGIYWQTHHILSMSDVYAPSYLLANVRKSELLRETRRRFGRRWWREPEAGAFLREAAMEPGASIDLDAFSRLDVDAYLDPILQGRS